MKKELSIRQKSKIHAALYFGGAAIIVLGCALSDPLEFHWLIWVGTALFLGSVVYRLTDIRCPHCGSLFRLRGGIPKHCPECGKYIDKFH